jgi:hypothetical protein
MSSFTFSVVQPVAVQVVQPQGGVKPNDSQIASISVLRTETFSGVDINNNTTTIPASTAMLAPGSIENSRDRNNRIQNHLNNNTQITPTSFKLQNVEFRPTVRILQRQNDEFGAIARIAFEEDREQPRRNAATDQADEKFIEELGLDVEELGLISLPNDLGNDPNGTLNGLIGLFDLLTDSGDTINSNDIPLELQKARQQTPTNIQSANNLQGATNRPIELDRESVIPSIVAVLRTGILYPNSEEEFQALIDTLGKLEINRQMSPNGFTNSPEQIGNFLGLPINLTNFRTEVVSLLNQIARVRNAVLGVRNAFFTTDLSVNTLSDELLTRLNYTLTPGELQKIPTSFFIDCLFVDVFGTVLIGDITSKPLGRADLTNLIYLLQANSGIPGFLRGTDLALPIPYPTERTLVSLSNDFTRYTFADYNNQKNNRGAFPTTLGGRETLRGAFRKSNGSNLLSDSFIAQIRQQNGSELRFVLTGDGVDNRFGSLPSEEKSRVILDPLVRELARSSGNAGIFNTTGTPFVGLDQFGVFQTVQQRLLGDFKALGDSTESPYEIEIVSNTSNASTRSALQTDAGDLVYENAAINRPGKSLIARPVSETILGASLKSLSRNDPDGEFQKLKSSTSASYDKIKKYREILKDISRLENLNTSQFIETRIKPCFDAMFTWSNRVPGVSIGPFNPWEMTNAGVSRYRNAPTQIGGTTAATGFPISGTELIPGRNDQSAFTSLNPTQKQAVFDLAMQEIFDRAYSIGTSSEQKKYREVLYHISLLRIMQSAFRGRGTPLGGESTNNKRIMKAFLERFSSDSSELGLIGKTATQVNNLEATLFNFAFLAMIKSIVSTSRTQVLSKPGNGGVQTGDAESETGGQGTVKILFDTQALTRKDFEISVDGVEYDLLRAFGSLESFATSLRHCPAMQAAYFALLTPPASPREGIQAVGLNVADMATRWVDKFFELNADCFAADNPNFTKRFPYSFEMIASIGISLTVESFRTLFRSNNPQTSFNRYQYANSGSGRTTKTIRPIKKELFNDIITRVNAQGTGKSDYLTGIREGLVASLNSAKSLLSALKTLENNSKKVKDSVDTVFNAVNTPNNYTYLSALSANGNSFSRKILQSITSGYAMNLSLCNEQFKTREGNETTNPGQLPMSLLRGGITQGDALSLVALMGAAELTRGNTAGISQLSTNRNARRNIFCVGIPNGFMSSYDTDDYTLPIKSSVRKKTNAETKSYNGINYRATTFNVYRRDNRWTDISDVNVSKPLQYVWPINLKITRCRKIGTRLPQLDDYRNNAQGRFASVIKLNKFSNLITNIDFFTTLLSNFEFTFNVYDTLTGAQGTSFAIGSTGFTRDNLNALLSSNPELLHAITSYCLHIFYAETVSANFDELVMTSDARYFNASLPTLAIDRIKGLGRQEHNILGEEIESYLSPPNSFLGFSRRNIVFPANTNLNSQQTKVLAFLLSAANKTQSADGFFRSISPKAFEHVAYIPVSTLEIGFDVTSKPFSFRFVEDTPAIRNTGGGSGNLFAGTTTPPGINTDRSLSFSETANDTLPSDFWFSFSESNLT